MVVQCLHQSKRIPIAGQVDMGHLPCRMHPGVGPTRTLDPGRIRLQAPDRRLDNTLYRRTVGLTLPADERAAVIFQCQFEAWHGGRV